MANFLSGIRVLFSVALLFAKTFSPEFHVIYIISGISDVLDGIVARKLHLQSSFGEKLDTVADICFVGASLYKLLPAMKIPMWLWVWLGFIALLKLANILYGFMLHKKFAAKHTVESKITGVLLFLFPYSLLFLPMEYCAIAVCSAATVAAIRERICIKREKQ